VSDYDVADFEKRRARKVGLTILILVCVSLYLSGQTVASTAVSIKWRNLEHSYKNFNEIKPVLLNQTDKSIFLSRLWPDGSAQLERYDESRHRWELGEWGIRCGLVAQAGVPIEIRSRSERAIDVYWQLSTDDWNHPKHFVVQAGREKRPLPGKYRFTLRYALTPWTIIDRPAEIYAVQSPEFNIQKD
jgi:hypothetical protein